MRFDRFAKELEGYEEFVDIDFIQTVILLKEARKESILNSIAWNLYDLAFGYDKTKDSVNGLMQKELSKIVSSVKFFFTLIFDDCVTNFVARHNNIWLDYFWTKFNLVNCLEKPEFGFSLNEKSLLKSHELFATTPEYDAWVDETLSIYAGELMGDGLLTSSEAKLFNKFYSAFFSRKIDQGEYFGKEAKEALLYPIAFRLKAETTEGKELRAFVDMECAWNDNNFEIRTKYIDEIKRGEHRDFNDFFVEFILNSRVSELKKDANLNYDFMPENYKN